MTSYIDHENLHIFHPILIKFASTFTVCREFASQGHLWQTLRVPITMIYSNNLPVQYITGRGIALPPVLAIA